MSAPRVLFVDNFDSFTYNLVEYVEEVLGTSSDRSEADASEDAGDAATGDGAVRPAAPDVAVVRNTASLDEVRTFDPDAIVLGPGPGHPENERDVGVTTDVLREVSPDVPTLGVCLGLEAAVHAYGGTVGRAPEPVHGKAFPVEHDGKGAFRGLEQGFRAGRYHSLVATDVPDCFAVTATTEHGGDGETASGDSSGDAPALVMGVRHREYPIECVQFHPESVLTAVGHDVVRNFLSGVTSEKSVRSV